MDERKLSIKDLKNDNQKSKITEVNEGEIKPYEKKELPQDSLNKDIQKKLDRAVNRSKTRYEKNEKEFQKDEENKLKEMGIDPYDEIEEMNDMIEYKKESKVDEDDIEIEESKVDEDDIEIEESKVDEDDIEIEEMNDMIEYKKESKVDEDDIEIEESKVDEDDNTKQIKEMKFKLKEKINPIAKVVDLKSFTISKKPVSVSNALMQSNTNLNIVDWVLPSTGKIISIKEFKGIDIEKLNMSNNRSRFNEFKRVYSVIYNHVADPNKPLTLEAWLKTIKFNDINHLYFAIYKSAFNNANYIPYQCNECKTITVTEDININDMIEYKNEKAKKYVQSILKSSQYIGNKYDIEIVQVSDNYAFGFKDPSIYDAIFQNSLLNDKFIEKNDELIGLSTYIDSIYLIDASSNQLRPIEFKVFDNLEKTVKSKLKICNKILKTLNSDQYNQVKAYKENIDKNDSDIIRYKIPEIKCSNKKCNNIIPENYMNADQMLFTRHQLAHLANI